MVVRLSRGSGDGEYQKPCMPWDLREQPEDRGRIHFVDVALDLPLISAEAHAVRGEDFGGRPLFVMLDDLEMQVFVGVNADVRRVSARDARRATVCDFPGVGRPCDRLCMDSLG